MGYPGSYDISLRQGDSFRRVFTWSVVSNNVETPHDLTGRTARMQLRKNIKTEETVLDISDFDVGEDRIILGGEDGTITIEISPETTATIPAGSYVYDLEIGGSEVKTLLAGKVKVTQDVTRG